MIKPATLRALAKQAGHAPAKIFKIQPEHLLEMLEENFEGIKEWTEEQAKEKMEEMKSSKADKPVEKVEEEIKVEEKKEEKPKQTRKSSKKKEVIEPTPEIEESEEEEEKPIRRRRKKSVTPVAKTPNNLLDGQLELLNLKLDTLVKKNEELSATVNTMVQFLAWFHNVQIDPKDPIASLGDIDWNGCIKDQM